MKEEVSLQDKVRPLVGGIQIQGDNAGLCTLGIVAEHIPDGALGFVTASHCGNTPFKNSGTVFSQNAKGDANRVALETINPPFRAGVKCGSEECPNAKVCRCSDTLFAKLDDGVGASRGFIARPSAEDDPDKWDGKDKFRIVAESIFFLPGATVHKVGRTTGLTKGKILQVCSNVKRDAGKGPKGILLCLYEADYKSAGGDSGAPVFVVEDKPEKNDVHITGIHRGRFTNAAHKAVKVFSAIGLVQNPAMNGRPASDLGPLKICAPGPFQC